VALATNKNGKAIVKFELLSNQRVELTDFTSENLGYPVPYQKYILYNSPRSGMDNIYALDVTTNNNYQITSSQYGSYNPAVSKDGKTLFYNEQGRDGLDVVKAQNILPFRILDFNIWLKRKVSLIY